MTRTEIYLIQQGGGPRVTFGVGPDAQAVCDHLQASSPEPLELVSVMRCRNVQSGVRITQMLCDRYRATHQGDGWHVMPPDMLEDLRFWLKMLSLAASTARGQFYAMTGLPPKKHPRSQLDKAVAWLQAHDPECTLPCRTVAARAGVSSGTAHKAARYLLALKEAG